MLTAEKMAAKMQAEEFILDYECRVDDSLAGLKFRLAEVRQLMSDMRIDPLSEKEKQCRWRGMVAAQEAALGRRPDDGA